MLLQSTVNSQAEVEGIDVSVNIFNEIFRSTQLICKREGRAVGRLNGSQLKNIIDVILYCFAVRFFLETF